MREIIINMCVGIITIAVLSTVYNELKSKLMGGKVVIRVMSGVAIMLMAGLVGKFAQNDIIPLFEQAKNFILP